MIDHFNIKIKKTLLALLVCFIAIPLSRFISPQTIIDGNQIYLAWLPLSLMYSVLFIFGRYAVAPLIIAFAITNAWIIDLTLTQALILLFCQLFSVFLSCAIVRFQLGRRWRAGLTAKPYGRKDFLGRLFCTAPFEGHHVSGGAFFLFRWQYPAISAVCRLFTPLSIYKA